MLHIISSQHVGKSHDCCVPSALIGQLIVSNPCFCFPPSLRQSYLCCVSVVPFILIHVLEILPSVEQPESVYSP